MARASGRISTQATAEAGLLDLRRRKMARSAFAYFRGSGEEFFRRWLRPLLAIPSPSVWLNGDMHLENFGTYRSDNRLTYFDIGDFDDACQGPANIDLLRFLTGILLAAPEMGIRRPAARRLAALALRHYRAALVDGKARWLERRIATGAIGDLLRDLERRSQAELLEKRTEHRNGGRHLRFDTGKALPLQRAEAARVVAALGRFARRRAHPDFFRVLDVAQRVAGLGALGRRRYVVLVHGNGGHDGQALIDLKLQPGSILAPLLRAALPRARQPDFPNAAARVVAIEYHLQAAAPAFLTDIEIGGAEFTFRELQPDQDKLECRRLAGDADRRDAAIGAMAELLASAQLRASGWRGGASIDTLMAWGAANAWPKALLAIAEAAADAVEKDWRGFARSLPEAAARRPKFASNA